MKVAFIVNEVKREVQAPAGATLLDVIREDLGLTGAKEGCGKGECGACTVLIEGNPMPSCLILAASVEGKRITTIEGISPKGGLHPLQKAFVQYHASQCGFCTPGMILTAKALLGRNPDPSEAEVREALAGNLCRCTGYEKIVEAILAVAHGDVE